MRLVALLIGLGFLFGCQSATAQKKGKPAKTANYDSQKETIKRLSAAETVKQVKLPPGFQLQVFAAEPDVQQPIGITTDHRGRLWVAECYTYADRTKNFDRRLNDQIVILEDQDGDGKFDKRTVFWDKAKQLTSVAVGFGGVWAICAPNLLFIPDRDGDDRPDGKPIVVLDGFDNGGVRHNIANGLMWGPDGWLYGRHGILRTSFVGSPGTPRSKRAQINCGIWRYHPIRKTFEVVARGTTNSWGADFDDHGQLFFINTVIGHLWHVVPGAHFERMYGTDFDPYLYRLIPQTADHFHWDTKERWNDIRNGVSKTTSAAGGGHAHCGLMIYLGDNWPAKYRNNVFTVNLHGLRINRDTLERRHSGYVARHKPDLLSFADQWFRGIELTYGPDGGVFILDWSDIGECHENDGVHRSSGRIYKLTYGKPKAKADFDLSTLSSVDLAKLQTHPNDWYVRQSRRLLQERHVAGTPMKDAGKFLLDVFKNHTDVRKRLRAMWCLYLTGQIDRRWLAEQLRDKSEHIRAWSVKLLADGTAIHQDVFPALVSQAVGEKSGLVRLYLASAMQKLPYTERWLLAKYLCGRPADEGDQVLPLMIWYGIAEAVPRQPRSALEIVLAGKIPLVQQLTARRLTERIKADEETVNKLLSGLGTSGTTRLAILRGMNEALRGWAKVKTPGNWKQAAQYLQTLKDKEVSQLARSLGVVFGDGRAISELRKIVQGGNHDPAVRRGALRTLVQQGDKETLKLLRRLVDDRILSNEAIAGLGHYDAPDVPQLILSRFLKLDRDGRLNAITSLSSRPLYASHLLDAVKSGRVERREITAFHARQISSMNDPALQKKLTAVWGDIRSTSADKKKRIAELSRFLTVSKIRKADRRSGRALFKKSCANCHRLFGEGERVGPDLTGANRRNIAYLLENIVDPSATVASAFRMSVVTLKDGRVFTGVVLRRGKEVTEIQTQKKRITVQSPEIARVQPQKLSLMPDGLFKQLKPDQIRDLMGYLSAP